jgi:RNA polymerase sigma-70 factor (ECF subfamily)
LFNEGYAATSGELRVRVELSNEAIRLTRLLVALMPDEPEVRGLLALMLLTDARRPTRQDGSGDVVPLDEQDRTQWSRWLIAAGLAELRQAALLGQDGPYQLQAAIAAVHARANTFEQTNWRSLGVLYDRLHELHPSAIVALNRAAVRGMIDGFDRALDEIDEIARTGELEDYDTFHATRADVLRRLGRMQEARDEYRRAIELTENEAHRRFLQRRLDSI